MEQENAVSSIHREWGYEIRCGDDEIVLIDRRTWPLSYVMGILSGLAALLIALGILAALGSADSLSDVPPIALFGVAAVLVLILAVVWRAYRRRRDCPLSEVAGGLVIDLPAGVLRDRSGDTLASLDRVRVGVRVDWWWTRTLMRLVVLSWPAGRRVVFRTASRRRAREVAGALVDTGVGGPRH